MAGTLIPQALWFRLAFDCLRIERLPRSQGRGGLLELPESCRCPAISLLDGRAPWWQVHTAWNPGGLGLSITAEGSPNLVGRRGDGPDATESVQVWIDTRDTRNVHRGTRYCHRFAATLAAGRGESPAVRLEQKPVPRAQADAPRARIDLISAQARRWKNERGWALELFFPATVLHGFDPDTNRRLGLMVQVSDPDRGEAFLSGLGREFPIESDPSLWITLELRDGA